MGKTQTTFQPDLAGGYNPTTDPLKMKPNELIVCQNALVSKPGGDATGYSTSAGALTSRPPMAVPASVIDQTFAYGSLVPGRVSVARCDSTEGWITGGGGVGGTSTFALPVSQGNSALQVNPGPYVGIGGSNLMQPASKSVIADLSGALTAAGSPIAGWSLKIDGFISGNTINAIFILFGDTNFNQAYYILIADTVFPTGNSIFIIPFDHLANVRGPFNPAQISNIEIYVNNTSATAAYLNVNDMRFENGSLSAPVTGSLNFGQGAAALSPDGTEVISPTGQSVIVGCQDMALIGVYPFTTWRKLMVGFPHVSILNSPTGTNFYFAQIPDPNNTAQDLAVLMDGASTPQLFTPTASLGVQFSNIEEGQNTVQTITFSDTATSGDIAFTFNGQTTGNIAYNDGTPAATVQTALQALSTIGPGNCLVSGDFTPTNGLTITFIGKLGSSSQPSITITSTFAPASGTISFTINDRVISGAEGAIYITPSQAPVSGSYTLFDGTRTSNPLAWNSTAAQILYECKNGPLGSYTTFIAVQGSFLDGGTVQILEVKNPGGFTTLSVTNSTLLGNNAIVVTLTNNPGNPGPTYNFCWTYKDILFLAGNPLVPFTVQPSDIFGQSTSGFYLNFDIGNALTVKSATSTKVTGGYDMDNYCAITTDKDIFILWGSDPDGTTGNFDLQRTKSKVGCVEMGAGCRVGGGLYFYSGEDFYVFDGMDSVSITNGKLKAVLSRIPIAFKRAVSMEYNTQRNILVIQVPQTIQGFNWWVTLTMSLDNGAWGGVAATSMDDVVNNQGYLVKDNQGRQIVSPVTQGTLPTAYCGLDMPTDGTQSRTVFFQFGNQPIEWDPPGENAQDFGDQMYAITAFNFCKSPMIQKDFMRLFLMLREQTNPNILSNLVVDLYCDEDIDTVRQTIVNPAIINGKIDLGLTGVTGSSIAVGIGYNIPGAAYQALQVSGYLLYWQAMEDL